MARCVFFLSFFLVPALLSASLHGAHGVAYEVRNDAAGTRGGAVFANMIGVDYASQTMAASTDFIWKLFQQTSDADRKPVQRVSLVVDPSMDGVAATSADVIKFSASYLAGFSGDVRKAFTGILYHEMTHVWQWDGRAAGAAAPGWLIEGVADFVRLKSGFPAEGWRQAGEGTSWTDSYDVTARFLDYCEGLRGGFVAELNKKIKGGYKEGYFAELTGKTLPQLWADYKRAYGH